MKKCKKTFSATLSVWREDMKMYEHITVFVHGVKTEALSFGGRSKAVQKRMALLNSRGFDYPLDAEIIGVERIVEV